MRALSHASASASARAWQGLPTFFCVSSREIEYSLSSLAWNHKRLRAGREGGFFFEKGGRDEYFFPIWKLGIYLESMPEKDIKEERS